MSSLLKIIVSLSLIAIALPTSCLAAELDVANASRQPPVTAFLSEHCFDCHQGDDPEADFDLSGLPWELDSDEVLQRWVKIHDLIASGEMPPPPSDLSDQQRGEFLRLLERDLNLADSCDVMLNGRAPCGA